MIDPIFIAIYIVFFISTSAALYVTVKLIKNGKNYLIAVISSGMVIVEVSVLSSLFISDFKKNVPKIFCISQALAIQYGAFLQMAAGLCFSYQTYRMLVINKQGNLTIQKIYIGFIIVYPIALTVILAFVAIPFNAIGSLTLNCDIRDPLWVRLIGYSGSNFLLAFIGVYLSARSASAVYRHLDRFRSTISSSRSASNNLNPQVPEQTFEISAENHTNVDTVSSAISKQKEVYNMTKAAAIRMVFFSTGFAVINFFASIQTIFLVVKGENKIEEGLSGHDWVGATQGLIIYLIFGLPHNVARVLTCRRRRRRR